MGLPVPPGSLVILVGPAGAGKSTWAARHAPPGTVLSSDEMRAMVAGDAADQSASADAFRLLHAVVEARLRRGLLTVVDATNLLASSRLSLLRVASRHGRPAAAVVFDVPLETCLARDAGRDGRSVGEDVVRRQHGLMARAISELPAEGFAVVLRT